MKQEKRSFLAVGTRQCEICRVSRIRGTEFLINCGTLGKLYMQGCSGHMASFLKQPLSKTQKSDMTVFPIIK
jgi:hypothetical protein